MLGRRRGNGQNVDAQWQPVRGPRNCIPRKIDTFFNVVQQVQHCPRSLFKVPDDRANEVRVGALPLFLAERGETGTDGAVDGPKQLHKRQFTGPKRTLRPRWKAASSLGAKFCHG